MEGIRELRVFSIKAVGIYLGGGCLLDKHLAICIIPSDKKKNTERKEGKISTKIYSRQQNSIKQFPLSVAFQRMFKPLRVDTKSLDITPSLKT